MPLQCIAMLALDSELQNMLLDAGVLWFLVHFIFLYDYTLEEGGVERAKESNKQVGISQSLQACVHCTRTASRSLLAVLPFRAWLTCRNLC